MKTFRTKWLAVSMFALWLTVSPAAFADEDIFNEQATTESLEDTPSITASPERMPDGLEENGTITEKSTRRSRRQADRTLILQDDADVNICLGYSGLKNTAAKINSFLSLLVNFDAINNISFDLQGMYALLGGDSSYYYFGGGATWFSQSGFRNAFVSANGGIYVGPALTESIPAARLLGGWRFYEPTWIATVGISAGPEFVFASSGVSTGLIFRADMGFTW